MSASQNRAVLALLRERGRDGVTPLEALDRIGTLRLGARVWDLRKEGHLIVNKWKTVGRKRVACYVLVADRTQLTLDGGEEVIAEVMV